ncbi:hypothetical protein IFM89_031255, partial [Coptis chinensis]
RSLTNTGQHIPSLLGSSVFTPNSPIINMSSLLEEGYINSISSCFPYSISSEHFQEIPLDIKVLQYSNTGPRPSVCEKQKTDSSSIVVDLEGSSNQDTQMMTPMEMKRTKRDGSCLSSAESKDSKRARPKPRNGSVNFKKTEKKKSKDDKKNKQKRDTEAPLTGYVHVRARRGQATDRHSLAERVRRERISERLKLLQSLVPGCDRVTSKALMLDEIINYVQSLQYQVEFLSLKIASMSLTVHDFGGLDFNCLKPEETSNLASQLPPVQLPLHSPSPTAVADITTSFTSANGYPLVDSSVSHLQQEQRPSAFCQNQHTSGSKNLSSDQSLFSLYQSVTTMYCIAFIGLDTSISFKREKRRKSSEQ